VFFIYEEQGMNFFPSSGTPPPNPDSGGGTTVPPAGHYHRKTKKTLKFQITFKTPFFITFKHKSKHKNPKSKQNIFLSNFF
jgi:hypothetical protein